MTAYVDEYGSMGSPKRHCCCCQCNGGVTDRTRIEMLKLEVAELKAHNSRLGHKIVEIHKILNSA
jgi:hypothetical protein